MRILIGVDDTDNSESRGTGFLARQLGELLIRETGSRVLGITRHQLLVAPGVPYTSHNSSACLDLDAQQPLVSLVEVCRAYLAESCAVGSDPGLCVARWDDISDAVHAFGRRAKSVVVRQAEAMDLARRDDLLLEGLAGSRDGVIGALAAVGLRREGNDGRFIWLRGIRELSGVHFVSELLASSGIQSVQAIDGTPVLPDDRVSLGDWFRPILRGHRALLLVTQPAGDQTDVEWHVAPKERIKAESD